MNRLLIVSGLASALLFSAAVYARTVVQDVPSYKEAIKEACTGKQLGAQCTVEFTGGSVSVGVCVEVPNSPVGGQLQCKLNIPELANCKNNALGTPGSWITLSSLVGLLFFLRRRRQ